MGIPSMKHLHDDSTGLVLPFQVFESPHRWSATGELLCCFDADVDSTIVRARMNLPTSFALVALLAASSLLAGCSSTPASPMSRIDANRAEYDAWPLEVKQAVLDGRIEKGMTTRQVEVAIGKPTRIEVKETRKGLREVWTYKRKEGGPLKGSSWSIGTYGVGVQTAPSGVYDEEYEVVFEDGVVESADVPAATR